MPENLQKLNQVIQIDEDVWRGSEVRSMLKKPSADVGTIKNKFLRIVSRRYVKKGKAA